MIRKLTILTFLSLLTHFPGYSQKKICEEKTVMFSQCYSLEKDGTFTYTYRDCTGGSIGKGKYVETKKNISFFFETVPTLEISKKEIPENGKTVTLNLYDITDKNPMPGIEISYGGQKFMTDENGTVSIAYSEGPITIHKFFSSDRLEINPKEDKANRYNVFWQLYNTSLVEKGTVTVLRKKGSRYKFKEATKKYNEKTETYRPYTRTAYYAERKD
ncbi:hypothetical protein [Flavobacterium pedocola]